MYSLATIVERILMQFVLLFFFILIMISFILTSFCSLFVVLRASETKHLWVVHGLGRTDFFGTVMFIGE